MNRGRERNEGKAAACYSGGLAFMPRSTATLPERSAIRYVKYTRSNYHHTKVFARFDRAPPHRSDALAIIISYTRSGRVRALPRLADTGYMTCNICLLICFDLLYGCPLRSNVTRWGRWKRKIRKRGTILQGWKTQGWKTQNDKVWRVERNLTTKTAVCDNASATQCSVAGRAWTV